MSYVNYPRPKTVAQEIEARRTEIAAQKAYEEMMDVLEAVERAEKERLKSQPRPKRNKPISVRAVAKWRDPSPWTLTYASGANFPMCLPASGGEKRVAKVWNGVNGIAVNRELREILSRIDREGGFDRFVVHEASKARSQARLKVGVDAREFVLYRLRNLVFLGKQTGAMTNTRRLRRLLGDSGKPYIEPTEPAAVEGGALVVHRAPLLTETQEQAASRGVVTRRLDPDPRVARREERARLRKVPDAETDTKDSAAA